MKTVAGPAFTIRMTVLPPEGPAPGLDGVEDTSVASKVTDELELDAEMVLVLEKLGVNGWATVMG